MRTASDSVGCELQEPDVPQSYFVPHIFIVIIGPGTHMRRVLFLPGRREFSTNFTKKTPARDRQGSPRRYIIFILAIIQQIRGNPRQTTAPRRQRPVLPAAAFRTPALRKTFVFRPVPCFLTTVQSAVLPSAAYSLLPHFLNILMAQPNRK